MAGFVPVRPYGAIPPTSCVHPVHEATGGYASFSREHKSSGPQSGLLLGVFHVEQ